jgi:hypothetical protein
MTLWAGGAGARLGRSPGAKGPARPSTPGTGFRRLFRRPVRGLSWANPLFGEEGGRPRALAREAVVFPVVVL